MGTWLLAGVPYAAIPGSRPLELDLYLPAYAAKPAPVVVFLHGGGWRLGSRHSLGLAYADAAPTPFQRLAQGGLAVASADYRLSGEARWPAQLHDAKAAVRWLRARASELGIDQARVAAWGESAGGHLAALLGLTGTESDGEVGVLGPSSAVGAVVAWYAPSDLTAVATDLGADPMAADPARPCCWASPCRPYPSWPPRPARCPRCGRRRRRSCCCTAATTASSPAPRASGWPTGSGGPAYRSS